MFDGAAVEQRRRVLRYKSPPQSVLLSRASRAEPACAYDHQGAHLGERVGLPCYAARAARAPTASVRLAFEACVIGPKGSLGG